MRPDLPAAARIIEEAASGDDRNVIAAIRDSDGVDLGPGCGILSGIGRGAEDAVGVIEVDPPEAVSHHDPLPIPGEGEGSSRGGCLLPPDHGALPGVESERLTIRPHDQAPVSRAGSQFSTPLLPEGGAVAGKEADPLPPGQDVRAIRGHGETGDIRRRGECPGGGCSCQAADRQAGKEEGSPENDDCAPHPSEGFRSSSINIPFCEIGSLRRKCGGILSACGGRWSRWNGAGPGRHPARPATSSQPRAGEVSGRPSEPPPACAGGSSPSFEGQEEEVPRTKAGYALKDNSLECPRGTRLLLSYTKKR